MMNYIWLFLILISIITAAVTGKIAALTQSTLDMAGTAVSISIGLIGIMTLWLGMMKIAETAGFIRRLARLLTPASKRLFPGIPADHPAVGSMMLNISATWLGLGNAATPFGIKAMEQLQELNADKETASEAMIMFLGLNTAGITLVPMTIIAVRAGLGSTDPGAIIGTTLFASVIATITAVVAVKFYGRLSRGFKDLFKMSTSAIISGVILLATTAGIILLIRSGFFHTNHPIVLAAFRQVVQFISTWTIPFLLFVIPATAVFKKVKVYEVFIDGAKEGFQVAVRIIPFLVAILVAIAMFRVSGALEVFVRLISPLTALIGMPAEVLPAALMRPLSGSGTLGIITELMKIHGPDSFIGNLASTIYGCSETTFYVVAVYFGAVGVKKTRYAIPVGLTADLAGVLAALFICRIIFL
jgi:spore maturation protein SpmA